MPMTNFLKGKGTYIMGFTTALFGLLGIVINAHDQMTGINYVIAGFTIITGRRAIGGVEATPVQ